MKRRPRRRALRRIKCPRACALLEGAIDIHVHPSPSVRNRRSDAREVAAAGSAVGMRGVLLKDHDRSTVADARLTATRAALPFEMFSSVVLNSSVGGLSPAAVESSARM